MLVTSALLRVLHQDGYNVYVAGSGAEALQLLREHGMQVAVSDFRMPGMNGVDVVRQIKQVSPDTLCIMMSGHADLVEVVQAFNEKLLYKFLPKPWENVRLREMVLCAFREYERSRYLEEEVSLQPCRLVDEHSRYLRHDLAQTEAYIEKMSNLDTLTGLANRSGFSLKLQDAIAHRAEFELIAVVLLDLEHYKRISDTYGYAFGDQLLLLVAERLQGCIRECDAIAHLGGGEFAFMLSEMSDVSQVGKVTQKLMETLESTAFTISDQEMYVVAHVGISVAPYDGASAVELIQHADAAMEHARKEQIRSAHYYVKEMNLRARQRLALEKELRQAIDRNEFQLYYQPKISVTSRKIVGMEALLRWVHPVRGLSAPGEFIAVLEETGLILPVGKWVLNAACRQIVAWMRAGLPEVSVAVNLSALQFQSNILETVSEALFENEDHFPKGLELELTESVLMQNAEQAVAVLNQIRGLGVRLSIDDFGTGYSSLSYLRRFALDSLKIDRSFVVDLPGNTDDMAIVTAIVALAHSLKLKVIAEGVETEEQFEALSSMGCDEIQGYLFGAAVTAEEMTRLLREDSDRGEEAVYGVIANATVDGEVK